MAYNFKILDGVLRFLYPPECAHCRAPLPQRLPLLCSSCLDHLTLVSVEGRCSVCFSLPSSTSGFRCLRAQRLCLGREGFPMDASQQNEDHKEERVSGFVCEQCAKSSSLLRKQSAALERVGPAASLITRLQRGDLSVIALLGALMVYQWLEHNAQLPDVIIPLPSFFLSAPSLPLAQEVGRLLSLPVVPALSKRGDWKLFLARAEWGSVFEVKRGKEKELQERKLLLVAPVLDATLFQAAAQALQPLFPQRIEAFAAVCSP